MKLPQRNTWETGYNKSMTIFDLTGLTPLQREITESAIRRTRFNYMKLQPKLRETKGKDLIPVEWLDLSGYATRLKVQREAGQHAHIHENGDTGHPIEARQRVLGLAWYSGKVSIDISLESQPELAQEVFLSEAAHMVDFFFMTDAQRKAIYDAFHAEGTPEHGHGWLDTGEYRDWVGEAFMGGFIVAFTDIKPTIPFSHPASPEVGRKIRDILQPPLTADFGGVTRSIVFHKMQSHRKSDWPVKYASRKAAEDAGRRPCKVCKP